MLKIMILSYVAMISFGGAYVIDAVTVLVNNLPH